MSCFMVDRNHIRYLIDAALSGPGAQNFRFYCWGKTSTHELRAADNEDAIGQLLWDENRRSVNARYPDCKDDDSNVPGPVGESFEYEHKEDLQFSFDPVQVLQSCSCFDYQACETSDWRDTAAHGFIDSLRAKAIRQLKGHEDTIWGAPEPLPGGENIIKLSDLLR